ncbi:hypothetical protein ACS5NO_13880 [Larkinella sp. GY13]|uniref:hypothetical protein n=1 Tax=Larkinella sp. GY13 TaxID=3453720 RepID=UPI003EE872F2
MSKPIMYFKSPNGNTFYALLESTYEKVEFYLSKGLVKTASIEREVYSYQENYEKKVDYFLNQEKYDVLTLDDYRMYRQRAMELLYDIYDPRELENTNTLNGVLISHL